MAWLFPKQKVGKVHNMSRDTAYFVAVHGVASGGPAAVLLVLDLVNTSNTKDFLSYRMRHILAFHFKYQENRRWSPEGVARDLDGEASQKIRGNAH